MIDIIEKFESSLNVLKTILQKEGLTLGAQTAIDLLAQIEAYKKEKLKSLSIADLVSLHTNFWLSRNEGARYRIITEKLFEQIEKEIDERLYKLFIP